MPANTGVVNRNWLAADKNQKELESAGAMEPPCAAYVNRSDQTYSIKFQRGHERQDPKEMMRVSSLSRMSSTERMVEWLPMGMRYSSMSTAIRGKYINELAGAMRM